METFTSKLEIHRAIIKVRRHIEMIEKIFSGDRDILHGKRSFDDEDRNFIVSQETEEAEEGEFYKLAQELRALESEHLAPLEASSAALELSEVEEKEVLILRKRMNSVASKLSLRFQNTFSPHIEHFTYASMDLETMIKQAEGERKRNEKIMFRNKIKRRISIIWSVVYQCVVFLGAGWVVFSQFIPWLLRA